MNFCPLDISRRASSARAPSLLRLSPLLPSSLSPSLPAPLVLARRSIARLLKTPRATESTTPELVTLRRTAERSGALVFVAED